MSTRSSIGVSLSSLGFLGGTRNSFLSILPMISATLPSTESALGVDNNASSERNSGLLIYSEVNSCKSCDP